MPKNICYLNVSHHLNSVYLLSCPLLDKMVGFHIPFEICTIGNRTHFCHLNIGLLNHGGLFNKLLQMSVNFTSGTVTTIQILALVWNAFSSQNVHFYKCLIIPGLAHHQETFLIRSLSWPGPQFLLRHSKRKMQEPNVAASSHLPRLQVSPRPHPQQPSWRKTHWWVWSWQVLQSPVWSHRQHLLMQPRLVLGR